MAGLSAVARAQAPPVDAVESYLESRGLTELRAQLLWDRLHGAPSGERVVLAERLAEALATLLEQADSADARALLERRSRELLELVPQADSFDLRLSLHRASYARAERLAERWRLRLVDRAERTEALRVFESLARELTALGSRAHRRVEELERQEESALELDLTLISERLADARQHRSLAFYLAGWAQTYIAELTDDAEAALQASRSFGWLLNANPGAPAELERFPERFLEYEHVARGAVGASVTAAVRGRIEDALAWLDRVEKSDDTPDELRAELLARRMTILARANRWGELDAVVRARREGDSADGTPAPLTIGEARLLAVLAFEAKPVDASQEVSVQRLAEAALTDLVAQGELPQVLDLASSYGAAPLGGDGFIVQHVRGLRAYEGARKDHRESEDEPEEPTADPAVTQQYLQAASALEAAMESSDADRFPGARGATAMLLGLSLYYASGANEAVANRRLGEAAERLQEASLLIEEPDRAADALTMAIRSLELVLERAGEGQSQAVRRREELVAMFLTRFPDHPRAGAMLLKQAGEESNDAAAVVATLLRVPDSSPAYETARRRAARVLYDLYRAAPRPDRDWAALRYVDVAEPLLEIDRRLASEGGADAAERVLVRARRILDALLSVDAVDASRAELALDAALALEHGGFTLQPDVVSELDYRRAQIALAQEDFEKARGIVQTLRDRSGYGGETRWASAAERLFLADASRRWRDAKRVGASDEDIITLAADVVRYGSRLLYGSLEDAERAADIELTIAAIVGEAAADLWRIEKNEEALALAQRMHGRVLEKHPFDHEALRRLAMLSEDAGDLETAVASWRRLSAGLAASSSEWWEARVRLIEALAKIDAERAREALRQHVVLHPSWGPAPWGERLRGLARRIGGVLGEREDDVGG